MKLLFAVSYALVCANYVLASIFGLPGGGVVVLSRVQFSRAVLLYTFVSSLFAATNKKALVALLLACINFREDSHGYQHMVRWSRLRNSCKSSHFYRIVSYLHQCMNLPPDILSRKVVRQTPFGNIGRCSSNFDLYHINDGINSAQRSMIVSFASKELDHCLYNAINRSLLGYKLPRY